MPHYSFKLHTLGYLRSNDLAQLHTKLHFRSEYTSLLQNGNIFIFRALAKCNNLARFHGSPKRSCEWTDSEAKPLVEKRSVETSYRALSKIECLFATCIKNLFFILVCNLLNDKFLMSAGIVSQILTP